MSRSPSAVAFDPYVHTTLLRDLVGHDKRPAAFLLYAYLYAQSAACGQAELSLSLRELAEQTGLSKSALHTALAHLNRRRLIASERRSATARPVHRVFRPWRR